MNFFKAVFTDEDDHNDHDPDETQQPPPQTEPDPEHPGPKEPEPTTQAWTFGGLMKTLQVKSDWIETYKRDLEEFGTGLKKETQALKEVANKSLEIGQTSLESVGNAVDSLGTTVWNSTAEIISQGKDVLLAPDNNNSNGYSSDDNGNSTGVGHVGNLSGSGKSGKSLSLSRYSRLRGVQSDVGTYVEEVEGEEGYGEWRRGFDLGDKEEEIDGLMRENEVVEGIYRRLVGGGKVDHDVFWCRYYYRVYKLERAENVRAKLVKRTEDDEEELSWDVDDDDEEVEEKEKEKEKVGASGEKGGEVSEEKKEEQVREKVKEEQAEGSSDLSAKEVVGEGGQAERNVEVNDDEVKKEEEKVVAEVKAEPSESGKDSDISVVSTQASNDEDDMGWDEIEDIGSGDEKKDAHGGSPDRAELRKRLSAAADDEDLSWDIEDDDEPVKA